MTMTQGGHFLIATVKKYIYISTCKNAIPLQEKMAWNLLYASVLMTYQR